MATKLAQYLLNNLTAATFYSTVFPAGSSISSVELYSGSQPASPQDSPSGSLLATITITSSDYSSGSGGIAVFSGKSGTASGTGTIGWARVKGSGGTLFDTHVTLSGGGGGVIVASLSTTSGQSVSITNMTIKQPLELNGLYISNTAANRIVDYITGKQTAIINFSNQNGYFHIGDDSPSSPSTGNIGSIYIIWTVSGNTVIKVAQENFIPSVSGQIKWYAQTGSLSGSELRIRVSNVVGAQPIYLPNLAVAGASYIVPAGTLYVAWL
jgi:hypothetical protein